MRELKRSIARYLMQLDGIEKINKRRFTIDDPKHPNNDKKVSFFSLHWKEYMNMAPKRMKSKRKRRRFA